MLRNDIRYALRLMRRSPGFTAVAVLSLALGIGANTAIFSLFNTILLRQLPVAHPEQLVEFLERYAGQPRGDGYLGWEKYEYFRDSNHVFSALTGTSFDNAASARIGDGESERVVEETVLGNYFGVLGLKPAMGRLIGPADVKATGVGDVVVVSWFYWDTRLHRDQEVLGKRIFLNDSPVTIVGVAPRAYAGPRVGVRTDFWIPREKDQVSMIGRLKPGVTLAQAQAEMSVLFQNIRERSVKKPGQPLTPGTLEVESAAAGFAQVRDLFGKSLVLLMGVVGLLLLLACINMASMLLARGASRRREMAVRIGLGASRGRLVRQMLTESLLLSLAGTLAGTVLAYFATGALVRIMASGRLHERIVLDVEPDLHLILFAAGIAVLTGILFGLAPAWYAFRSAPEAGLRQQGRAGETRPWRLFGKSLVAAQVALSILLLTAAGVFLTHLSRMRNLDLGFRSDHVLLIVLDPSHSGYKREQLAIPYQQLLARLETIPGVRSASITACTPIQGCGSGARFVSVEGNVERPEDRRFNQTVWVAPKYFETLGVPLVAGRDFSFRDAGHPPVVIISQAMAHHYFQGGNPVGKYLRMIRDPRTRSWTGDDEPYEIVGVAGDAKLYDLREPPPLAMYLNMFQGVGARDQFELRTSVDPTSVAAAAQRAVRDVLKNVPVTRITTLSDQVDSAIVPERLVATLSSFFGVLGAALAGIGLYGLLAYTVARRTNEIGVRMALGATAGRISRLVLGDALGMVSAGLILGTVLVLWSRPLAMSLIQDLKQESPAPLIIGGAAIFLVALAASYVPARRASHVDPLEALRHE